MYTVTLPRKDYTQLHWFVSRGYFPESIYVEHNVIDQWEDKVKIEIPEFAAWDLLTFGDDLFTCMGGDMLTAFLELRERVV